MEEPHPAQLLADSSMCVRDVVVSLSAGWYKGRVAAHCPAAIYKEKRLCLFCASKRCSNRRMLSWGSVKAQELVSQPAQLMRREVWCLTVSLKPSTVFYYSVYLWVQVTFAPLEGCRLFPRRDWKPLEFSPSFSNTEKGQTLFSSPSAFVWSNCINIRGIFA